MWLLFDVPLFVKLALVVSASLVGLVMVVRYIYFNW